MILGGDGNDDIDLLRLERDASFYGNNYVYTPGDTYIIVDRAPDVIDAGAGDDTIRTIDGSTITTGDGADEVVLGVSSDISLETTTFTDFDPTQDSLEIQLLREPGQGGALSVVERGDGSGSDIYYGTAHIAALEGTTGLSADDITLDIRVTGTGTFTDGADDQTIALFSDVSIVLHGGDGDDTLTVRTTGNGGNEIHGDSGNDILTVPLIGDALRAYGYSTVMVPIVKVSGGDWDDIVSMSGTGEVSLGAGADTLNVCYPGAESTAFTGADLGFTDPDDVSDYRLVTDFDPAEDTLGVNANPSSFTLLARSDDSALVLAYADADGSYTYYATLAGLGAADIANVTIQQVCPLALPGPHA